METPPRTPRTEPQCPGAPVKAYPTKAIERAFVLMPRRLVFKDDDATATATLFKRPSTLMRVR